MIANGFSSRARAAQVNTEAIIVIAAGRRYIDFVCSSSMLALSMFVGDDATRSAPCRL